MLLIISPHKIQWLETMLVVSVFEMKKNKKKYTYAYI